MFRDKSRFYEANIVTPWTSLAFFKSKRDNSDNDAIKYFQNKYKPAVENWAGIIL